MKKIKLEAASEKREDTANQQQILYFRSTETQIWFEFGGELLFNTAKQTISGPKIVLTDDFIYMSGKILEHQERIPCHFLILKYLVI